MKILKKVYISSGGYRNISATETVKKLVSHNIFEIELSGGKFSKNLNKEVVKLSKKHNLRIHNYFPPPKKPFVINLASSNKTILNKSINHAKKAINLAYKMKSKFCSFHAGFLIDPNPKLLGKNFDNIKITDRNKALEIFKKSVFLLNRIAKKKNIKFLIENNVITKENLKKFKTNPLLLTNPKEITDFFKITPKGVGFLLDVAHLKVSSNTEGFSLSKSFNKLNNIVSGYHLSDNNSLVDSNQAMTSKTWFFKYLKKDLDYYTIEVYNNSISNLKQQQILVEKFLNN